MLAPLGCVCVCWGSMNLAWVAEWLWTMHLCVWQWFCCVEISSRARTAPCRVAAVLHRLICEISPDSPNVAQPTNAAAESNSQVDSTWLGRAVATCAILGPDIRADSLAIRALPAVAADHSPWDELKCKHTCYQGWGCTADAPGDTSTQAE